MSTLEVLRSNDFLFALFFFPVALLGATREKTLLKCFSKFLNLLQNLNLVPPTA